MSIWLFSDNNSLLRRGNSLFCVQGILRESNAIPVTCGALYSTRSLKSRKFPVFSLFSRESDTGDGFAHDCAHHQSSAGLSASRLSGGESPRFRGFSRILKCQRHRPGPDRRPNGRKFLSASFGVPIFRSLSLPRDVLSHRKPENLALTVPVHGQDPDALEPLRRQVDGLTTGQNRFDDIGSEECELQDPADIAGVGAIAFGNVLNAFAVPGLQRADPLVSLGHEAYQITIQYCGPGVNRPDDKLSFSTAALEADRDVQRNILILGASLLRLVTEHVTGKDGATNLDDNGGRSQRDAGDELL